jgi:fibro-slime domain-containing protein
MNHQSRYVKLQALVFGVTGLGLLGELGCGARSAFPLLEPCYEQGVSRKCQDVCGIGQQTCDAGYWRECIAPIVTEGCSNNCGSGEKTCDKGAWGECVVADSSRVCTNECGTGAQVCSKNSWSECAVADSSRSCTNECGTGTQVCSKNTWATCEVAETTEACTNDCGTGSRSCKDNTWSSCTVIHQEKACSSVCGTGKQTCDNNLWSACDAPQPLPPKLHAVIRDFRLGQPIDFGHPEITGTGVDDRGIVQSILGSDDTPQYAHTGSTATVQSPQTFYEWYHDVSGVNQRVEIDLPLSAATDQPGLFVYQSQSFFPIDGQLFGNEGDVHNYNFTLAISSTFTFQGNEKFTFDGDDDVFVFINRHLAIDLGGVHGAETMTVDLTARASELGLTVGSRYPIHIFFAERHPVGSDFLVETSIADIGSCP